MQVYCTCPPQFSQERPHRNEVDAERLLHKQQLDQLTCEVCGMSLILQGRYVPEQVLGRGGFGRTFRVIDLQTGAQVLAQKPRRVLKQLLPGSQSMATLAHARELFRRESHMLDRLSSNRLRVPQFFDYFEMPLPAPVGSMTEHHPLLYLVQEYIEGQTLEEELRDRFTQKPYSEQEVRAVFEQLLETLQRIHEKGVIHRDVKPSNIIRSQLDRSLYLIDFGSVTLMSSASSGNSQEGNTIVISPGFAPPEQRQGRGVTPASDLYSLAATGVCLLTRNLDQIQSLTENQLWRQHRNVGERFSRSDQYVSQQLADVLDRLLQDQPSARFQSAQAVLEALTAPPTRQRRWWRSTGLKIAAGGAAFASIIALFGWFQLKAHNLPTEPDRSPTTMLAPSAPVSSPVVPAAPAAMNFQDSISSVKGVPQGTIRYGGSTIWAALRRVIEPRIEFNFPALQLNYRQRSTESPSSESGISMLIAGELEIALSSKGESFSDVDRSLMQQNNVKLKIVPVAITGYAVAVHPSLDLPGLTRQQFEGIRQGTIRNWQAVGGPNRPIRVFTKNRKYVDFDDFVPIDDLTTAIQKVAADPGGIYWTGSALLVPQCQVKLLPLGKTRETFVPPYRLPLVPASNCPEKRNQVNTEAIGDGSYPVSSPLSVVMDENRPVSKVAGEALVRMLQTQEGQQLIREAGFFPLAVTVAERGN